MKSINSQSLILAIDTSTPTHSIALLRGKDILCELLLKRERDKGSLLRSVDNMLRACSETSNGLDAVVLGVGPGAFTGLRVSMALAKSLAFAKDLPVYPVSSLRGLALAAEFSNNSLICACIDARKKEIYADFYRIVNGRPESLVGEKLYSVEDWATTAKKFPALTLVGNGVDAYKERFDALELPLIYYPRQLHPHAARMAIETLANFENQAPPVKLEALEPRYIREDQFDLPKAFDFGNPN